MTAIPLFLFSIAAVGGTPQGVLLDFTSPNCGPCQQMVPVVNKLHRQGYPIRKINVLENAELADKFGIESIPAFVLVVNGREVNRIVGPTTEGQLKRMLAQIPSAPAKATASRRTPKSQPRTKPAAKIKSIPVVTIADSKPKKRLGFEIPFFKKKRREHEVIVDRGAPDEAVFRANNITPSPSSNQGPIAASTRIRVKDSGGINFGSGTFIASQPGQAIILTCGHIFRDLRKEAEIEVDVFDGKRSATYTGTLIRYDLDADVGLLGIESSEVFPVAEIATASVAARRGDRVFSIGCSGGEAPTIEPIEVTGVNKYRGPDNIECTGLPVPGRSGGGLFDRDGRVLGVCLSAFQNDNRGFYAGLQAIHTLLNESNLSDLYRNESTPTEPSESEVEVAEKDYREVVNLTSQARAQVRGGEPTALSAERSTILKDDPRRAAANVQSFLENAGDSEVVCIIRPLNNPQAVSQVVIINQASSKFVRYLQGELRNQSRQTMARTSFKNRLAKKKTPEFQRRLHRSEGFDTASTKLTKSAVRKSGAHVDHQTDLARRDIGKTVPASHRTQFENRTVRRPMTSPLLRITPDEPRRYRRSTISRR